MRASLIFCSINFLWAIAISVTLSGYGRKHLSNRLLCCDFGSTTIQLFQWHQIGVFKSYTNSYCISSQHFWVITTPVTRTSEIYFLVGCPGEKQTSECLWRYKLTSFLTPSSIFCIHDVTKRRKIAFQRCYQVYKIPANFIAHTHLRR